MSITTKSVMVQTLCVPCGNHCRHYRLMFAKEFGISPYDVTDERQCGSRRY